MKRETPAPVLAVDNLSVSFRHGDSWQKVVRNISFSLYPGKTLAIVGESGSGKSVTAMAIMRLLSTRHSRTEGQVLLGGKSLLALPEEEMRRVRGAEVAMIFQEPMTSLNPAFTIGNQIAEVFIRHQGLSARQAKQEAIALLEKVRIPHAAQRFDEYPHQFSGGMRQRAMIAMALALKPKLLIADEPTTALDVTIQGQILDLIKTLQAENNTAVLFITHDMGVVAETADDTLVMFRGDAIECEHTPTLFAAPQQPYTRALLASVPAAGEMDVSSTPCKFPSVNLQTGEIHRYPPEADLSLTSNEPVLSVKNLVTRFPVKKGFFNQLAGYIHAVENVSFDLWPGETLSLVGESGCGKSTTGRSLIRLVQAQSGHVRLHGYDVLQAGCQQQKRMRQDIQMIFQDPFASLNPRLKIQETLIEPLLENGLATRQQALARAHELIEKVGLSVAVLNRYPHEFSGGQRQRICIARALAMNPKVIIADESVSALDVSVKAQVVNLIIELQRTMKIAFLFISHDMAVIERISHRVAVMYLGEIVEIGPRQAIFANPQHPYTQKLIAAIPKTDPSRRHLLREANNDELPSPFRDKDWQPPTRRYEQVGNQHWVMR
ncbi:TPA: ABC transporter ATP-binding protein [Klebsiella aerogenes]|uniref:ABC transporter ATP-binding protein n=1 Tax=Klebsiella aerogenes TaxID=548 RepID=UPI000D34E6E2|nr:ABC transporter ATP-binding protein [Klebsiella aerogenes]EKX4407899.1 ABC transporter ATP-binding protein [Klebsiella aerogenes]EKZ6359324.1 ABC transporter ATP-binding protein [Klebsiella aerogenes]HCR0318935.1 ABC transporter ATP-binding protein [Klebsiella aerogenes]HCR2966642.1 ABC transporter ATP-binding protein [Klebsiella aerogenes]HDU3681615.1 ABC transporter ATP-binding protein [Klebsiella aerogenes]